MTSEIKLSATARTEFGKGASRRLRRAGQVPAVLYGHGTDPIHLSLPAHDTQLALRTANALLSIVLNGGKPQLALPKQVQRDPIKSTIEHVDLVVVRAGEKVQVEVPINLVGDVEAGAVAMLDLATVTIEADATKIPAEIEVDVDKLEPGAQINLADLVLPAGSTFVGEPDTLVLSVSAAPAASVETEEEGAEGEAAATEE